MEEFVSVDEFYYDGKECSIGDGDSFCYCPCDIYGTPKLFYGEAHYECAVSALYEIMESFNAEAFDEDYLTDDEWNGVVQELWTNANGRGRVVDGKYIIVGEDGHIPTKEYVNDIISYLGGTIDDYVILYNQDGKVHTLKCSENFEGQNDKPSKMDIPYEITHIYKMVKSKRASVDKKFPTNMTRAEYYSLLRQEGVANKTKTIIRETIENFLKKNIVR